MPEEQEQCPEQSSLSHDDGRFVSFDGLPLVDETANFFAANVLREGQRFVWRDVVYKVTFINTGKMRYSVEPIGLVVHG